MLVRPIVPVKSRRALLELRKGGLPPRSQHCRNNLCGFNSSGTDFPRVAGAHWRLRSDTLPSDQSRSFP